MNINLQPNRTGKVQVLGGMTMQVDTINNSTASGVFALATSGGNTNITITPNDTGQTVFGGDGLLSFQASSTTMSYQVPFKGTLTAQFLQTWSLLPLALRTLKLVHTEQCRHDLHKKSVKLRMAPQLQVTSSHLTRHFTER